MVDSTFHRQYTNASELPLTVIKEGRAMPFVKIHQTILDSSVWLEPHPTRILWITMLAMANEHGIVEASPRGLASRAHVTYEELQEGIECLASPDPDSKSQEHNGCRIEAVPGGWLILNHTEYRDRRTTQQILTAARVRKHKANKVKMLPLTPTNELTIDNAISPSEVDTDSDIDKERKGMSSKSDLILKEAVVILEYMNSKRKNGRPYGAFKTKKGKGGASLPSTSLGFILARLRADAKKDDCIGIINLKAGEWLSSAKMKTYFRPSTLFNETNFDKYVAELPVGGDGMDGWHPEQSKNY